MRKDILFPDSLKNLKAIGAVSIELLRKQKLTTYTHTLTHTHIHTFSEDDFFFNVGHIYTKKKSKFDNRFLTPIQGFTQSKIEKAIILHLAEKHSWNRCNLLNLTMEKSFVKLGGSNRVRWPQ